MPDWTIETLRDALRGDAIGTRFLALLHLSNQWRDKDVERYMQTVNLIESELDTFLGMLDDPQSKHHDLAAPCLGRAAQFSPAILQALIANFDRWHLLTPTAQASFARVCGYLGMAYDEVYNTPHVTQGAHVLGPLLMMCETENPAVKCRIVEALGRLRYLPARQYLESVKVKEAANPEVVEAANNSLLLLARWSKLTS